MLSVFKLQCDLFSLARITSSKDGESLENSEILDKLKQPNPFQGQRQFLWDYMFWNMFGFSTLWGASKVLTEENNIYWLNTAMIEFPNELQKKLDKHYFSKGAVDALLDEYIIYHYSDNTKKKIQLKEIYSFADLSNGLGNWFGSPSALDALYKVVSNSEAALNAKNVNLEFAGKYLVGGDTTAENIYEQPLGKGEQKSIEDVVTSGKKVTAVKSAISIARFVDNIAQLELDKSYFADYYIVGKMYGIPREVLEANLDRGSTFTNQSIARASHVEYTLQPKGDDLTNGIERYFNLTDDLIISWDHLNFTQETKKAALENDKLQAETIKILLESGVSENSINELLGTNIIFDNNNE